MLQRPTPKAFSSTLHDQKTQLFGVPDPAAMFAICTPTSSASRCVAQHQVLNSGQESRKSIAPYLAIPALRRVISTFANDPSGQFANWSTNPEVREVQLCESISAPEL